MFSHMLETSRLFLEYILSSKGGAGAAGGAVRWYEKQNSLKDLFPLMVVGFLTSFFLSDTIWAIMIYTLPELINFSATTPIGLGFIVGYLGITSLRLGVAALQSKMKVNVGDDK